MKQVWRLQGCWYVVLVAIAATGLVLIWLNPQTPPHVQRLSVRVKPDAWSILIGVYLLSIVLTHLLVFYSARIIRVLLNLHGADTLPDLWSPSLVGICESILYPSAFLLGRTEFIGVWLAVKVAGQWVRWTGDPANSQPPVSLEQLNEGRRRFNGFLVGNALSIMSGVATYAALKIWALA